MKKLKLNLQHLENVEVLTRSQLKKVLGGFVALGSVNCGVACGGDYGGTCDNPHCSSCISKDDGPYVCVSK